MQFTSSQSELSNHLSLVSRVVPSRPNHPILANVLLEADAENGLVSLTGFDLSIGIKTEFAANVLKSGKVTLPAKLLNDIVSRLPEGELTLKQSAQDEETINLVSTSGEFQIRGLNASQYPNFPTLDEADPLILPIAALIEGLKGVLFAASNEDTKQILTGVHLKGNQEQLEFAATDSHRLAVVETPLEETAAQESKLNLSVTIPAKALRELERIISSRLVDETITLYVSDGQLAFDSGAQRLVSRKLDGNYPAYSQLIPKSFKRTAAIERKSLISKLELVSVLADQKNHLVKFSLDTKKSEVELSVDAQELGNAKEIIAADITGDSGEIAFNVKYLLDGLKALPSTDILMQFNEPNQPVIFSPLGGAKMTYLVMPVQIIK